MLVPPRTVFPPPVARGAICTRPRVCLGKNHDQVLEIGENLKVLMSEERIAILTKEIDDWAAKKAEEDSTEVTHCCPWGARRFCN